MVRGILLQMVDRGWRRGFVRVGPTRRHTKDRVDDLSLCIRIDLGYPADLSCADCMHNLVTLNVTLGSLGGPKTEARTGTQGRPALAPLGMLHSTWVQIEGG
jgi:hypothetical protein